MRIFDPPQRQTLAVRNGLREVRTLRINEALAAENQRRREVATQAQVDRAARIAAAGGIRQLDSKAYKRERAEMLRGLRHL